MNRYPSYLPRESVFDYVESSSSFFLIVNVSLSQNQLFNLTEPEFE